MATKILLKEKIFWTMYPSQCQKNREYTFRKGVKGNGGNLPNV